MSNKKIKLDYSFIAHEYYDAKRHPTCANFREASKSLIHEHLKAVQMNKVNSILEIGAGKSIILELILNFDLQNKDIIISDKEIEMLKYSEELALKNNCKLTQLDAQETGLTESSIDLIISSLGDPYNTRKMWNEIYRVLSPNGIIIFTTPSFQWSSEFRKNSKEDSFAEFLTTQNKLVRVPSYIYNFENQKIIIESSGFSILNFSEFKLNMLTESEISNKLKITRNPSITSSYLIKKNFII